MVSDLWLEGFDLFCVFLCFKVYFLNFIFICHPIITKNIGKEEKKKWQGDLTETMGAYERLGLLELRARAVSHQSKKRWWKVEDGKIYVQFSYLLNNLIFSFFLKEERDWELMNSLSSELKNLGPWKKGENFLVFVRQYGRRYIWRYIWIFHLRFVACDRNYDWRQLKTQLWRRLLTDFGVRMFVKRSVILWSP